CYPIISHLYLMLNVDNPTPHGFFFPGYSGPDLVQEVLDSLATVRPPYIVLLTPFGEGDPVATWIRAHYEPIDGAGATGWVIYRPKPDLAAAAPRTLDGDAIRIAVARRWRAEAASSARHGDLKVVATGGSFPGDGDELDKPGAPT